MQFKYLPLTLISAFFYVSCSPSEADQKPVDFKGNWVSKDFVDHLAANHSPKQVFNDIALYITEIVIDPIKFKDSVVVYNGQKESAHLPFKRSGDTLHVQLNNVEMSEIVFSKEDSTISFIDKRLNRVFRFMKADSADLDKTYEMPLAFPTIVNRLTLAGDYQYLEQNKQPSSISLSNFGNIKGHPTFDVYNVFVNGEMADSYSEDFVLFTGQKAGSYFAMNTANQDSISLFDLTFNPNLQKMVRGNVRALLVRKKNNLPKM